MFRTSTATVVKFGSLVFVCLVLSQPAFAQVTTPRPASLPSSTQTGTPLEFALPKPGPTGQSVVPPVQTNAPGLRQISQPNGGQPGFGPGTNQPELVVQGTNVVFSQVPLPGSTAPQSPSEIVPLGRVIAGLFVTQNAAMSRAITACSSGPQSACDDALVEMVAATLALNSGSTPAAAQKNLLMSLRQVVASVSSSPDATVGRAINIATIDAAFARAFPEISGARPSNQQVLDPQRTMGFGFTANPNAPTLALTNSSGLPPGAFSGPTAQLPATTRPTNIPAASPGSYVSVTNGQIVITPQAMPSELTLGQFGFTPNVVAPATPAVPRSPGITFQPPTSSSGAATQQPPRLEVDGRNLYLSQLRVEQDQALLAAVTACSSGSQATCDVALRALIVATQVLNIDNAPGFLRTNLLTKFREVIAGVRARNGAGVTPAINIAAIDNAFARLFPESTATRPSSPS